MGGTVHKVRHPLTPTAIHSNHPQQGAPTSQPSPTIVKLELDTYSAQVLRRALEHYTAPINPLNTGRIDPSHYPGSRQHAILIGILAQLPPVTLRHMMRTHINKP
jgi:hypothetical protein